MQTQENIDPEKSALNLLAVAIADAERFRWGHTANSPESNALISLELRRINGDHPSLDEWRRGHDEAAGNTVGVELGRTAMGSFILGLVAERDALRAKIASLACKAPDTPPAA